MFNALPSSAFIHSLHEFIALEPFLQGYYSEALPTRGGHLHDAFPPVSDFPRIFEKFLDSIDNFLHFTFSPKISPFSAAKISDDLFLVIDHKFRISPYFPYFGHFPPVSRKLFKFPPVLEKITCFLHTFVYF